jgi:hypothetical protein
MNTYYKESTEFQEVGVSLDDLPTTQFEVAMLPVGTRPTDEWAEPYTLEGRKGVLLKDKTAGEYAIWVRVTDLPETPVLYAGRVSII